MTCYGHDHFILITVVFFIMIENRIFKILLCIFPAAGKVSRSQKYSYQK